MSTKQQDISGVTSISTPSDREIASERIFDAPRERVFAAYTEPELIARWWGPRGTSTSVEQMDVRPGGVWRFVIRNDSDGQESAFKGVYREVTPPERIVQSFEWEGMPGRVVIEPPASRRSASGPASVVSRCFTPPRNATGCSPPGWRRG